MRLTKTNTKTKHEDLLGGGGGGLVPMYSWSWKCFFFPQRFHHVSMFDRLRPLVPLAYMSLCVPFLTFCSFSQTRTAYFCVQKPTTTPVHFSFIFIAWIYSLIIENIGSDSSWIVQ